MMCYDSFEGSSELKSGLQEIASEAKIFDKDLKLGEISVHSNKRKSGNIHTKDKKRKRGDKYFFLQNQS